MRNVVNYPEKVGVPMSLFKTDRDYLVYQYSNSEKLRIRYETHELYSRSKLNFRDWVLSHLDLQPGQWLLDVGCGPGEYHPHLKDLGIRAIALDFSFGMAQEAAQKAAAKGLPVYVANADATCLPLPDAFFDRLMANHMLYHVPDKLAALREMRRVVKPGGRVLLATNAADNLAKFRELHLHAAQACGYQVPAQEALDFRLDSLPLVQEVFPNARIFVSEDAFLFPAAEPALRYWASGGVDYIVDPPLDGSHRARILTYMGKEIEAIIARDGVFEVSKGAGVFVANL
jgi:ubiquinone/menaquinone biosynthesis C-methylase UbiE